MLKITCNFDRKPYNEMHRRPDQMTDTNRHKNHRHRLLLLLIRNWWGILKLRILLRKYDKERERMRNE
jgi:hypothetical protein